MPNQINAENLSIIVCSIFVIGLFVGWLLRNFFASKSLKQAEQRAQDLTVFAEREAESFKKEAELASRGHDVEAAAGL